MGIVFAVAALLAVVLLTNPLRGDVIKDGVNLTGLQSPMLLAVSEARRIYENHGAAFVITSALDGAHQAGSLHFVGLALDFRTRHLPAGLPAQIARELEEALGREFDVVLESDHIHVEFQPKKGANLV